VLDVDAFVALYEKADIQMMCNKMKRYGMQWWPKDKLDVGLDGWKMGRCSLILNCSWCCFVVDWGSVAAVVCWCSGGFV